MELLEVLLGIEVDDCNSGGVVVLTGLVQG